MSGWETLTWAATVACFFGCATFSAEKLVSRKRADELASLVHIRDDATWVQRFLSAFDALFTTSTFTIARLLRSMVATTFGLIALWVLFNPVLGLMGTRSDQSLSLGQLLVLGIAINFAADFLSLAETRWILNRFRHVRSFVGHLVLLLFDLVFSATLIWVAIAIFRLLQSQPVLHPIELVVGYSVYAIFFYSTFLTSIWAWAYALAILFVRILSSKPVERISNFEAPFAWLAGLVAVMVFVFLVVTETLRRNMPDDLDSQVCAAFGGVLCTHAARLTPDQAVVVAFLTRACDTGDAAQCRVALGGLSTREGPQAARLLENACVLSDDMPACRSAGYIYNLGLGVVQDLKRAQEMYTRACDGGDLGGCNNLGSLYREGFGAAQGLTRAHLSFSRACNGGNLSGCTNLGLLYHQGLGVSQNLSLAQELYTRSCNGGEMSGCNNLGFLHQHAAGVAQDLSRAHELYTAACNGGDMPACNNLGFLYDYALGVPKDLNRAEELYNRSCEAREEIGCNNLRNLYKIK